MLNTHRLLIITSLIPAIVIGQTALATAHQPVSLTAKHSSPNKGPIMVDGTISFALRANFKKPKQQQGFRAAFKAG